MHIVLEIDFIFTSIKYLWMSWIIPILKENCGNSLPDLRPLSILTVLMKLFEKLMDTQLKSFSYINETIFLEKLSYCWANHRCNTAVKLLILSITVLLLEPNQCELRESLQKWRGFPQGFILGPISVIIYNCRFVIFAFYVDHIQLYY